VVANDRDVVALSLTEAVIEGTHVTVQVISGFHCLNGLQQERWFHPTDLAAWDLMLG
jgi:hypothetical protein